MTDIKQVADAADMIVNGYAFTRCTEGYRALWRPEHTYNEHRW